MLEYALAFTSAALDKYCTKWSASSKTGFIDITTSRDFYRIYSGLQVVRNLQRVSIIVVYYFDGDRRIGFLIGLWLIWEQTMILC